MLIEWTLNPFSRVNFPVFPPILINVQCIIVWKHHIMIKISFFLYLYLHSFVNEIFLSETETNTTTASRRIPTTLILENISLCPLKWLFINLKDVWQLCTTIYLWNIQPKDDVYVWMNNHKEGLILWLSVIIRQCYYQTTSKCENIRILSLMEGCAACGGLTRN